MSTQNTPVTAELKQVVDLHPEMQEVHFTADGHYHLRAFPYGRDLYTRLEEVPETTKTGLVIPNKFKNAPIKGANNEDDPAFKIVATMTREAVLSAKIEDGPKPSSILTKAELLLSAQDLTEAELKQLLKEKSKK